MSLAFVFKIKSENILTLKEEDKVISGKPRYSTTTGKLLPDKVVKGKKIADYFVDKNPPKGEPGNLLLIWGFNDWNYFNSTDDIKEYMVKHSLDYEYTEVGVQGGIANYVNDIKSKCDYIQHYHKIGVSLEEGPLDSIIEQIKNVRESMCFLKKKLEDLGFVVEEEPTIVSTRDWE